MILISAIIVALASCATAFPPTKHVKERGSPVQPARRQASSASPYKLYTIDQPVDHFPDSKRYLPHTKATFKQQYVFDSTYYKPGGPVFLYIGGETSVQSRFSNLQTGIIHILMNATNGLGVILENRYYGQSWPTNSSTTDGLAYLTTEQTIADNAYFAQHARFPGIPGNVSAPGTPWILYGGSLAGAQTAFSIKEYGGGSESELLWGGIASSAVIQAKLAYPEWYNPIQKYASGDCTSSINAIIDKMDYLIATKNTDAIQKLKEIFGLGALEDIRDFAMTIAFPIGGPMNYPTNTWQEIIWGTHGSPDFFNFCKNVTNLDSPADITAVDNALAHYTHGEAWLNLGNYANYVKKTLLPLCESGDYNNVECFGTQNETFYAITANSGSRSYLYSTCTEQGAYQVAQPHGPSLISRVLQVEYTQQWCDWAFPPGKYNSIPSTPDLSWYNRYGGFDFKADRLALIDGDQDVWLDVCYHSNLAPSPRYSDVDGNQVEHLITGGGHHWDSYGMKDLEAEPQFVKDAHLWEIRTVKRWLKKWEDEKSSVRKRSEL